MRRVSAPPAKGWGSGLAEVSGLFHRKTSVTLEPITSEQATNGQRCSSYRSGPPSSQGEADREGACKSMNHYLVQANQQIAELTVQAARQRVIVKDALDAGQRSEMAESLLDALEGSLRIFEKHRIFLLSLQRIIQAPRPAR